MPRMTKKQKSYIDRDMMFFAGKVMIYNQAEFQYFLECINHIIQDKKIIEANKKIKD